MAQECSSVEWLQNLDWGRAKESWRTTVQTVITSARCCGSNTDKALSVAAGRSLFEVLIPGALTDHVPTLDEVLDSVVQLFEVHRLHLIEVLSSPSGLPEAECVLEVLLQHVSSLLKSREKLNTLYTSYLSLVLRVVEHLLTMCHSVEKQQGWVCQHLGEHLSNLFRTTYNLLKRSLDDIGAVPVDDDSSFILLTQLAAVTKVSVTFDPSLPVLCWKSLGKLLCKSKPQILSHDWSIQPIVLQLCVTIETKSKECTKYIPNEINNNDFQKLLKLCRFLSTLLVRLVQEFEAVSHEIAGDIVSFLLSLHTTIHAPLHGEGLASSPLEENVLVMKDPLISALSSSEVFVKLLLSPPDGEQYMAQAECLISLIKVFPKMADGVKEYSMSSVSSRQEEANSCRLLDAVFLCLAKCYAELTLPVRVEGIMYNGNPLRRVTLYEHVATHLSSLVQCIPVQYFHKIEVCLMKQLLSPHPYCSLMAMDVWTFMSRMATETVTESYVELLSKLVCSMSGTVQGLVAAALTGRLVALLSVEAQKRFVTAHPPSVDNLTLWAHIGVRTLHGDVAKQVCSELASTSVTALRKEMQKTNVNPSHLEVVLKCLCDVIKFDSTHSLPHHELASVAMALLTSDPSMVHYALRLLSLLLPLLPSRDICRVFQQLSSMVTFCSPDSGVAMALSTFLSLTSGREFPRDIQAKVLEAITSTFQVLLSHSHWLARHTALESFRAFAEVTPYANIAEKCIPPNMSEMVIKFINKVPHCAEDMSENIVRDYLRQGLTLGHQDRQSSGMQDNQRCNTTDLQDRQSKDCSGLSELKECWEKLKASLTRPSASQLNQLEELCSEINRFVESCK